MVKAPRGLRHRTRSLLRKDVRERGAVPPLSYLMLGYNVGDKVCIVPNPAICSGLPHRRYYGRVGTVVGRRGKAYIVEVFLGNKRKELFIAPEHLRPHKRG